MKTCCSEETAKTMAPALIRWGIGLLLFTSGAGKIPKIAGFAQGIASRFEETILPAWMVMPYGYVLPFVELLVGLTLILGLMRNAVLFLAGITFLSLAFGQMLLKGHATVANILVYLFMVAIALFLSKYDRWCVFGGNATKPVSDQA